MMTVLWIEYVRIGLLSPGIKYARLLRPSNRITWVEIQIKYAQLFLFMSLKWRFLHPMMTMLWIECMFIGSFEVNSRAIIELLPMKHTHFSELSTCIFSPNQITVNFIGRSILYLMRARRIKCVHIRLLGIKFRSANTNSEATTPLARSWIKLREHSSELNAHSCSQVSSFINSIPSKYIILNIHSSFRIPEFKLQMKFK